MSDWGADYVFDLRKFGLNPMMGAAVALSIGSVVEAGK